jgi:putative colanic acid biosynthesis acetyltransferase WcaF
MSLTAGGDRKHFSLAAFTGAGYDKGRPIWVQALWLFVSGTIVTRWWCPRAVRVAVLRAFGASIASGTVIRHNVKIHWPWKLAVGQDSWIGDGAWILNLEDVTIGRDTCISQGVLLCTGSHDQTSPSFEFDNAPIVVGNHVWIAARATVLRGVRIGDGATIGATALVTKDVAAGHTVLAPRGVDTG